MFSYPRVEIRNLDSLKNDLRDYYSSGRYYNEITTCANNAKAIINKYIGQTNKTIVIDIDETMISEWSIMQKYDFGWFDADITEAQYCVDFPAFQCIVDLVDYCMANGIAVNILSSRRQKYEQYTLELLGNAGYQNYTDLLLRPTDDTGTIQDYKIEQRQKIISSGYDIIVNIGDQQSDLDGGYADCTIKIPNPFYLITTTMKRHPFHE